MAEMSGGRSAEKDAPECVRHEGRVQNLDGDWLCSCGAFLCPPGDDRLDRSHQQHIETVLSRLTPPTTTEEAR